MLPWAARYNTWLLIKLTPKGVVFSFLFLFLEIAALPLALLWQSLVMNCTEHQHVHQAIQSARYPGESR